MNKTIGSPSRLEPNFYRSYGLKTTFSAHECERESRWVRAGSFSLHLVPLQRLTTLSLCHSISVSVNWTPPPPPTITEPPHTFTSGPGLLCCSCCTVCTGTGTGTRTLSSSNFKDSFTLSPFYFIRYANRFDEFKYNNILLVYLTFL